MAGEYEEVTREVESLQNEHVSSGDLGLPEIMLKSFNLNELELDMKKKPTGNICESFKDLENG